jgi:hypothetical protein
MLKKVMDRNVSVLRIRKGASLPSFRPAFGDGLLITGFAAFRYNGYSTARLQDDSQDE